MYPKFSLFSSSFARPTGTDTFCLIRKLSRDATVKGFSFSGPISFRWCALSHERAKCSDFTDHVKMMAQTMNLSVAASCVDGNSADDCIKKIYKKEADLVTLDGGNIHEAGKF